MKFLFDLFPVILFFVAFRLADIYVATAAAIAATFLQIGILALLKRKIDTMLWVSLAIIVVFGGATLLLRDETFIKCKPTVLYGLFGATLAIGRLAFRRNLLTHLMQGTSHGEDTPGGKNRCLEGLLGDYSSCPVHLLRDCLWMVYRYRGRGRGCRGVRRPCPLEEPTHLCKIQGGLLPTR